MPQVKTTYLVFPREAVEILGTAEATSAQAAVDYATRGADAGTYVAVPARNWTEVVIEEYQPEPKRRSRVVDREAVRPVEVHPDQTTIDDEVEAAELAGAIEDPDAAPVAIH